MAEIESTASEAEAERYRSEGNEHFRSFRYHNAINSYTRSLECYETSSVLANRAQAYLNTKQYIFFYSLILIWRIIRVVLVFGYERALMDSARALELDATNIKALFRYGKALKHLNLYEIAAEMISKIDLIDQKNEEIAKLKESVQNKEELSSVEIPPPPTTSYIFISDFHRLKSKPIAFAEYFLSIDKNRYGELFDEIIETEMIKCLIVGFGDLADESNIPQLLECLIKLADVSRIDIAVLFLDEATKNGLFL
ncbi:unnamed protein product [Litomosoides sigmodontis]|uniref:RNA polymerase II-associated protein 3 n=1 Tax=Litomosoides sigmodontis TaxID=42156 RepID=A0A3P6TJU8_LITSI|nr:unnamed protein product [Litomosoides sigmodontis]